MKLPIFEDIKMVNEIGHLTPSWKNILQVLFEFLQYTLSDEGFILPQLSENQINQLTSSANGTLVYDSTNNIIKARVNGSWVTIQTI